jgi:two-component system, NtrC family, response regulator AtoC
MKKATLYLVDDDPGQLALLTAQLERSRAFTTEGFTDSRAALERVLVEPPDAVVCDLVMPDMDGLEFTARLRTTHPTLPVIIASGRGSEKDAAACYEAGANDFVTKPVEPGTLIARIRKQLDEVPARELLLQASRAKFDPTGIVGAHPRVRELRAFIENVASVPTVSALILGESGTGKNLVARAIHTSSSVEAFRFVDVNCAALPANLLEAELFGYEKGAFTGANQTKRGLVEEANGGTLLLDEIGSMPLELQAKLLTFLESRTFRRVGSTKDLTVSLRVVAATNTDIRRQVAAGEFREDLFYRLNVATHTLPALREIRSDIPELTEHFVKRAADYFRKPVPHLDPSGLERLIAYDWPGNVRELRNVVERALIFARGPVLDFPPEVVAPVLPSPVGGHGDPGPPGGAPVASERGGLLLPPGLTLEEVERLYIRATLEEVGGQVNRAAERLGVSRKVLWMRRRALGILD